MEQVSLNLSPFSPEDLLKMRWVGTPRVSPCGRYVAFTLTEIFEKENTYVSSIWLYDSGLVHRDPSSLRRLTNRGGGQTGKDINPKWSPDGTKLAFVSDRSGSNQVFVLEMSGGDARQVTCMPKGVNDFDWLGNNALALSAKEEQETKPMRPGSTARRITTLRYKYNGLGYLDNLHTQIWMVTLDGHEAQRLTSGPYDCSAPVASPTGKYLAFTSNRSGDEKALYNDLYVLEIATGDLRKVTASKGQIFDPVFSPDERFIYYLGHEKGQPYPGAYSQIWRANLQTLEREPISGDFPHLIGGSIGGDVGPDPANTRLIISPCGKVLYFAAVDGGSSYLYSLDVESGAWAKVLGEGQMVVKSYHIAAGKVVINKATPVTMGDLWFGDLKEGELKMVTGFNSELASERYIGWPQRLAFEHPDGTVLEGWVILPKGFQKGKKYPLIMEIHGGPHTTYGNVFFHEFQILAGHGFGVLYTNPRGSMGYGEDFARAVVGDWCGVDARDLEFMAKEAIAKLDWVDPKRVGVTGGSQGGYFTNWLIGHTDIFAAAVTQRSMSNLYSKYGVSDIGWSYDRAGMGGRDLWEDEDFIMERSPIRYAPNVKTPTLVIHSDQDYRCPLEQGEQWYVALKRLGVAAEMLLFHCENHELSRSGKPANRIVRLEGILEWFERFLKSKEAV